MHRRLVIRIAVAAMLVALAAPLGVERSAPDAAASAPASAKPESAQAAAGSTPPAATATAAEGVASCEAEPPGRDAAPTPPEDEQARFERLGSALAPLAQSSDPEHLLALASLRWRKQPASSLALMLRALALDPDNPLIALDFAELCYERPEAFECAERDPEREILRLAGDNGAVWARVAAWRHRRGDRDGALDAMRRAAIAPSFDDYSIEHMLLFERAIAASTGYTYPERLEAALGLPAPGAGHSIEMINFCFGETASSAEWRRACVELGARMEANAGVIVVAAVGRELQEAAFRAAGNEAAVKSVEERSRVAFELIRESGAWSDELLHGDPAVLSEFMAEFITYGELAALRYLKETREDRAATSDRARCPR